MYNNFKITKNTSHITASSLIISFTTTALPSESSTESVLYISFNTSVSKFFKHIDYPHTKAKKPQSSSVIAIATGCASNKNTRTELSDVRFSKFKHRSQVKRGLKYYDFGKFYLKTDENVEI